MLIIKFPSLAEDYTVVCTWNGVDHSRLPLLFPRIRRIDGGMIKTVGEKIDFEG